MKPYSRASAPEADEAARAAEARRGPPPGRDRAPDEQRAFRDRGEVRFASRRPPASSPSATPKCSSIISERSQPGVSATAAQPEDSQLLAWAERQAEHRGLDEVVKHGDPVVLARCTRRAVGHLHHQAAGAAGEQRQREVARDEVGVQAEVERLQPGVQIVGPERRVPFDEVLAAQMSLTSMSKPASFRRRSAAPGLPPRPPRR